MIDLGMHTDNWRQLSVNFHTAVDTAVKYGLAHIEFGLIHGQYFVHGLGYDPAVSLQSNPRALKRYLDGKGLKVSQIDAAYPMMGPEGSCFGVPYVQQAIRFAAECGAAVKGDAYGLGIAPVARALWDAGCRSFFVARPKEGEELRGHLPDAVIYVLDGLFAIFFASIGM